MHSNKVPRRVSAWLISSLSLASLVGVLLFTIQGCGNREKSAERVVPTLQPQPVSELTRYAGNQACQSCHPREFGSHARSEHARAMARVDAQNQGALFQRPSKVTDPRRNIAYHTTVVGNRCVLVANTPQNAEIATAEYGFGSGKHGITYLGRHNDLQLELRLSYYPAAKRWAFSPGQQLNSGSGGLVLPTGLVKPAETVEGCFVCHSTVIGKEGDHLLQETVMMGVGCEACHGPGQEHIAAKKRGDAATYLVALKRLNGQQLSQQLCGQCHRSPAGEDMNDPFNRSQLPRLQGLALSQSLCFLNSNGKLSCTTCHDPHDQTPPTRVMYNGKCMSCHSGAAPDLHACRVAPKGDCVSCHMPAQPVGMPFDTRYRTHLIKVWTGR